MPQHRTTLTHEEISYLVAIAAQTPPEEFQHPGLKAVIYKARTLVEISDDRNVTVKNFYLER